jgi:hypothetical protein
MNEAISGITLVTGVNKGVGFDIARGIGGASSAPRTPSQGEAARRLSFLTREEWPR